MKDVDRVRAEYEEKLAILKAEVSGVRKLVRIPLDADDAKTSRRVVQRVEWFMSKLDDRDYLCQRIEEITGQHVQLVTLPENFGFINTDAVGTVEEVVPITIDEEVPEVPVPTPPKRSHSKKKA